ncbi:MAG: hypothetical protein JXB45_12150 [Candidatus Krumholzibacteriota bacterium]|nr:hypothetical protein [Candidatus Krumholzibacteriota bacterium]
MIRRDITRVFSRHTGIGETDFTRLYLESSPPCPIGDFNLQYVAGPDTLEEIFGGLAELTGLPPDKIKSHYHREESFAQFGEHLLRAGAYGDGGREGKG